MGKRVLLAGFCAGFLAGFARVLGDVNVAGWTDNFGWEVDNWGFSAGERRDVYVAGRTEVGLDKFGLGWLEPKERAESANHSTFPLRLFRL